MLNDVFERMTTSAGFSVCPAFFKGPSKRRIFIPFNISIPSTFEWILFFHIVFLLYKLPPDFKESELVAIKDLVGERIGLFCQTIFTAWDDIRTCVKQRTTENVLNISFTLEKRLSEKGIDYHGYWRTPIGIFPCHINIVQSDESYTTLLPVFQFLVIQSTQNRDQKRPHH